MQKLIDLFSRKKIILCLLSFMLISHHSYADIAPKGKVLVVVSNASDIPLQNNKRYATGYFLNELTVPVKALINAGYTPVFATPSGASVVWDLHSLDKKFFSNDEKLMNEAAAYAKSLKGLNSPITLAEAVKQSADGFVGILIPGGHGPMNDLAKNAQLGILLKQFHQKGKPTALICHGPIALLSTLSNPESFISSISGTGKDDQKNNISTWPYAGYRMTVFSTAEERIAEQYQLGGNVMFYSSEALTEAGALLETGRMWQSHVVKDRELITAQQPFSDQEFSNVFIQALNAYTH